MLCRTSHLIHFHNIWLSITEKMELICGLNTVPQIQERRGWRSGFLVYLGGHLMWDSCAKWNFAPTEWIWSSTCIVFLWYIVAGYYATFNHRIALSSWISYLGQRSFWKYYRILYRLLSWTLNCSIHCVFFARTISLLWFDLRNRHSCTWISDFELLGFNKGYLPSVCLTLESHHSILQTDVNLDGCNRSLLYN